MKYVYIFACHEDEVSLCRLEMRSLFGMDTESMVLESNVRIEPRRSPFIKERIEVIYRGTTREGLAEQIKQMEQIETTFKVMFISHGGKSDKVDFQERRKIERDFGLLLKGEADLKDPELIFAVMKIDGCWLFGTYLKGESVWLQHQKKPQNYSTALSTRVARAVVNIGVPHPKGMKAIDPCCGIGTVLIEALSMGIDIVGSDINPLAAIGARTNVAHFGFTCEVLLRDIRKVSGRYDVAFIDMPYNLCSVLDPNEQLSMLQHARTFTDKLVVITIETIDSIIIEAGFDIIDRCVAKKAGFTRQVIVCN
ncbi:RsmD family RNA methyltransferase [Desertibacillus haloalkaliphilus]|nr:RsmD family RNA methyltransferase [Desertibacillus haloalkaliphilus]